MSSLGHVRGPGLRVVLADCRCGPARSPVSPSRAGGRRPAFVEGVVSTRPTPRRVAHPFRCARGSEPGRSPIPPARPVTLGRAPPHLTLRRQAAPRRARGGLAPAAAGGGEAERARAPEPRASCALRPGLTSGAQANPEDARNGSEGLEGMRSLRRDSGRARAAPRTAPAGGAPTHLRAHAHSAAGAQAPCDAGVRGFPNRPRLRAAGEPAVAGPAPL